jgi:hypothetical protein
LATFPSNIRLKMGSTTFQQDVDERESEPINGDDSQNVVSLITAAPITVERRPFIQNNYVQKVSHTGQSSNL